MGIVTDPESVSLTADYRISTEEVYLSVAVQNLEKLKNLELLENGRDRLYSLVVNKAVFKLN